MATANMTVGRLAAATRLAWGHYYVTHDSDGWTVFDDRNPDGRARITDALEFDEAVEQAHHAWEDEDYGQGRARPLPVPPIGKVQGG